MDSIIQQIADLAIQAVAIAWRAQGHELTGNAVRQMETKITKTAQGYQIDGYVTDYMASLNTGVPASRIPYSPGSGARSSKYIQGLMDYAKKEAQKIAFAIASRHKREGMPTKASARFSSTGKRTQFIQDALQDKEAQFAELIERAVEESFNVIFTSSLQNALGR
jgi:hypothetical protein